MTQFADFELHSFSFMYLYLCQAHVSTKKRVYHRMSEIKLDAPSHDDSDIENVSFMFMNSMNICSHKFLSAIIDSLSKNDF